MAGPGRTSTAELQDGVTELVPVKRPDPPADLNKEQSEVWKSVVNALPADWFPQETHALLAQYCRHVIAAKKVAWMIDEHLELRMDQLQPNDGDKLTVKEIVALNDTYDNLLKMQEREGRAMSSLATRMRLTQQATYDPKKKKSKPGKAPWQSK